MAVDRDSLCAAADQSPSIAWNWYWNTYRPPMESESGTTDYSDWTSNYLENGYLYIAVMMGLVGLLPFPLVMHCLPPAGSSAQA